MNFVQLYANNVQISNVTLLPANKLQFNISWENSWRMSTPPANYDAVWIFIKRSFCSDPNVWYHTNVAPSGHQVGTPLEVIVDGADAKKNYAGLFLQRAGYGSGDIQNVQVQVAMDGFTAGEYEFKVFAVEMVYINQGPHWAGDWYSSNGASAESRFYNGADPWNGGAYEVINEAYSIPMGYNCANCLGGDGLSGTLPAGFPKGYNAIYCMKYEVTQSQMADFFNHAPQAIYDRWSPDIVTNAYGQIALTTGWGNLSFRYPWRPFTTGQQTSDFTRPVLLFWTYLDWAALRPMTELEYEKICRGPSIIGTTPHPWVINEFAWGTAQIYVFNLNDAVIDEVNEGTDSETHSVALSPTQGIANLYRWGGYNDQTNSDLYRVGFAAKSNTTRTTSGATYYGVMDMTGNAWEGTVMVTNGSTFQGYAGDGLLSSDHYYQQNTWFPIGNLLGLTNYRGGGVTGWLNYEGPNRWMVASRLSGNGIWSHNCYQFRGVR